jgi:glycosyltransferase involved in cell wall biosynthesis
MKFCAILRSYPKDTPGGAEYQSYLICNELASRGHDVHYIAHRSSKTQTVDDDGITVHRISEDSEPWITINRLKSVDADVYYFRLFQDLPLLALCKSINGGQYIYNISRDTQCKSIRDFSSLRLDNSYRSKALHVIGKILLKRPDIIFSQTKEQKMLLKTERNISSQYIGNGIKIPEVTEQYNSKPTLLWLSNIKPVKHPEMFLGLVDRIAELEVDIKMVGHQQSLDFQEDIEMCAEMHDNFSYMGGCSIQESNEYFRESDIFVHTGEDEGYPNTLLQSWAYSTPVVSRYADPDSAVSSKNVGVKVNNMDSMVAATRRLIASSEKRRDMGQSAREYLVENHDIKVVVDRIENEIMNLNYE